MPSRGMRWRRTRCLGGRLRRGLFSPAPVRMRRKVVPADVDAVALAQQLAEMRVVGPCVSGTSQVNTAVATGSGVALGGLRPR